MKKFHNWLWIAVIVASCVTIACDVFIMQRGGEIVTLHVHNPDVPEFFKRELRDRANAPLQVALVFGRAPGCSDASSDLINLVASEAVSQGVAPKVLAATIAQESQCNSLAVSSRGAIGLMQIMPRIWNSTFDFSKVNLFNPRDNIRVGTKIMAGLVKHNGLQRGVQLYNGAGVGCETCDGQYAHKVLILAKVNQ